MERKRVFDLLLTLPVFVVSLPIQGAVALLVRVRLGKPVLFRQQRPGLHSEPFEMVKFRTMLDPDPSRGPIDDADRLTPFGRVLRATSVDELPSLWNIVRGDMSLVGPRPLLIELPASLFARAGPPARTYDPASPAWPRSQAAMP